MSEAAFLDGPSLADEIASRELELVDQGDIDAYFATRGGAAPTTDVAAAEPFAGRSHDEVLALEMEEERQLVRDLVPAGAVGTIAGVPETHKSWLAQQIAVSVAKGSGSVLGCDVVTGGPVGYFWQDDSTREEVERVKFYEGVNAAAGAPLRWFLNDGVTLPEHLDRVVATVRAHELVLVVLDSFYNFLPGVDLKDDAAERIVAQLKRELADTTGCSVLIVDHMPWATDSNRQRLRAYGGVFKNAATRFGIYIDANGDKLHIEARGNNIRGFKKRAAYWDTDALELRLLDPGDSEKAQRDADALLAHLEKQPGTHSTTGLRDALNLGAKGLDDALKVLIDTDRVQDLAPRDETGSVKPGHGHQWIATIHAASHPADTLALLEETGSDRVADNARPDDPVSSLYKRQGHERQGQTNPEGQP